MSDVKANEKKPMGFVLFVRSDDITAAHLRSTFRYLSGAQDAADGSGHDLEFFKVYTCVTPAAFAKQLAALPIRRLSGLIFFLDDIHARLFPVIRRFFEKIPCVRLYNRSFLPDNNVVMIDYAAVMERLFHFFDAEGYSSVGFVAARPTSFERELYAHYRDELERRNAPLVREHVIGIDTTTGETDFSKAETACFADVNTKLTERERIEAHGAAYRRKAEAFFSRGKLPEVSIVTNARLCLDMMLSAQERGMKIPDDTAFAAMGKYTGERKFKPEFTSISDDHYHIGFYGVTMLMDIIEGRRPPKDQSILLDADLVYSPGARSGTATDDHSFTLALENYLRQHYQSPSVQESAVAHFGLSQMYFLKKVRRVSGRELNEIIHDIRIEKSKDALRFTNKPIIDIAFSVGYGDLSTFNRNFKRITGTSPRDFRTALSAT